MPVERVPLSISQFSELVGIEPAQLISVEFSRSKSTVTLCLEPEEPMTTRGVQSSGTCPPLSGNTSLRKPKKGGKK
jgi:hypothetical protein